MVVLGAFAAALAGDPSASATPGAAAAPAASTPDAPPPLSARDLLPPPNPLDELARRPATDVSLAPSRDGRLGAWLVAGPFPARGNRASALQNAPDKVDESAMSPRLGAEAGGASHAAWRIAETHEGPIDLAATLPTKDDDQIAYAAGTLHVERAGRFYLFLGADDGVRLSVDGNAVYARDDARPERDDDDVVPLDLAAGDHPLLLKLHQRDGGWAFSVRVVGEDFAAPEGAYLALPGTTAEDAADVAGKMSWISVERGVGGAGYAPKVTVRFPEGAPRGVPLRVRAKMVRGPAPHLNAHGVAAPSDDPPPAPGEPVFDVDAGDVPVDAAGAGELVAMLPQLGADVLPRIEEKDFSIDVDVAGRKVSHGFFPRRAVREAIVHAERALAKTPADAPWLREGSLDSVQHLHDFLSRFTSKGDQDLDADLAEARELDELSTSLEKQLDPYAGRVGAMRRAYRSPIDGQLSEYGLYVPASYVAEPDKQHPLVVGLHGMNGNGMAVMRWLFGWYTGKDQEWENRHPPDRGFLEDGRFDTFVVTPDAYGNAMYRDLGEDDVMNVTEWALRSFPIDRQKVSITGMSMGGIGTAAIAFHHPGLFSAAEPLCGYHSYFIRRDYGGRPVRPWEHLIADERSNVSWAYNGFRIPLWIVHGKKDLPEANSGVLIERYQALGYWLKHDHPDLGHNVWSDTYEDMKGLSWLLWHKKNLHPKMVRMRTIRTRFGDDAWAHIDALSTTDQWGELEAKVGGQAEIQATTQGIAELRFDRDPELLAGDGPITVQIDGQSVVVSDAALWLHKEGGAWAAGRATHAGIYKHEDSTGPIRDVFHQPLLFVYGASDPLQAKMNEEVAKSWARVRWGVTVKYPVMSDAEFYEKGEPLANDRALFLVGNAQSNRVVRELEGDLPIKVSGDAIVMGDQRFTGKELGAAFIRPNPKRPERYVVVVEGASALGTWRSLSLPDLLPDFVVYDARVAPSRGQQLLSAGMVLAGGFFGTDWSLPADTSDPSARAERPSAKSERDATSYLP